MNELQQAIARAEKAEAELAATQDDLRKVRKALYTIDLLWPEDSKHLRTKTIYDCLRSIRHQD